jgi:hypothetical protein
LAPFKQQYLPLPPFGHLKLSNKFHEIFKYLKVTSGVGFFVVVVVVVVLNIGGEQVGLSSPFVQQYFP